MVLSPPSGTLNLISAPSRRILEQRFSAAVPREYIAEIGAALAGRLRHFLEALELSEAPGDFEVRRPLAAIAGGVRDCKVVFSVEALFCQRVDMIYVKLPFMQNKVDRFVAYKAPA